VMYAYIKKIDGVSVGVNIENLRPKKRCGASVGVDSSVDF